MGQGEPRAKGPVKWLLGGQLIGALKQIVLYSLYRSTLDLRCWMSAGVHTCPRAEGDPEEYWFDYISDTGDSQAATYRVASLCLSDLHADADPAPGAELTGGGAGEGAGFTLPRGSFLFIGGDSAYHVADRPTLKDRLETPFLWAQQALGLDPGDRRPIFAIPGNHDYYDQLTGFHSLIRKPCDAEPDDCNIPGFRRVQQASYVAIALPFGWWLWGLDVNFEEQDEIDERQRRFFQKEAGGWPEKLIVATAAPSTVFGKRAAEDGVHACVFKALGLTPYLLGKEVEPGRCLLELSGDVHHYARYWGPRVPDPPDRAACATHYAGSRGLGPAPANESYASVVSGLGGAFLHPTETDFDEVKPQVLHPDPAVSRAAMAARVFRPWVIVDGGYLWVVGGGVAAVFYAASTLDRGARVLMDALTRPGGFSAFALHPQWTAFVDSVLVFALLLLSLALVAAGVSFGKWSYDVPEPRGAVLRWASGVSLAGAVLLPIGAAIFVAIATAKLAAFGTRRFAFDVVFLAALLFSLMGAVTLAIRVGAALHSRRGRLGFALLGLAHWVAQALTPWLLFGWPNAGAAAAVFGVMPLSCLLGYRVLGDPTLSKRSRQVLLCALGAVTLALTIALPLASPWGPTSFLDPATIWLGREGLAQFIGIFVGAGASGALLSCFWFGWYLAIAHAFDGHNNEVGGAARVSRFTQIIRFRVTPRDITGYVIGCERPAAGGPCLRPRVIDRFTLRPRPRAEGGAAQARPTDT